MKKLRWLSYESRGINNMKDVEGPNFLSNELRYFYWQWYPASPFLDGIPPMTLVVLKMSESWQKELWNGYKHLPHLKVLELEFMGNLLGIPDFGGLPCLKKLKLLCCSHLEEIHPSLGNHRSLENVSVSTCSALRVFPKIVRMDKLNNLEISDCNNYIELPEIQTKMERLVNLTLEGSENEFPDSPIGECYTHLETVLYRPLKDIVQKLNFRSLRKLNLGGWGLKDGEIPSDIENYIPREIVSIIIRRVLVGMDSQYDEEAWKERAGDRRTWVGFVSFDLLKHTSWWDETYSALSFSLGAVTCHNSGFGFGLVHKRTGIASVETSTCYPVFSNYSPNLEIIEDSASALWISFSR